MADDKNEDERSREFLILTDEFIDLANNKLARHDPSMIGAAFMFASSRFCAFSIASKIDEATTFEKEKGAALEHYSGEFYNMLEQNIDRHDELLNEEQSDETSN